MEKLEFPDAEDKVLCVGTDDIPVRSLPFLIDVVGEKPRSFTKPVPQSDVLERLKAFLPELKKANALLAKTSPDSVNIENFDENSQYIEMDLGLGVFEKKEKMEERGVKLVMPGSESQELPLFLDEFILRRHESSDTSCEDEDFSNSDISDEENT